jgi:hypothetical protein
MTDAIIGYGSRFAVSRDGGLNYVEIAEVYDITPPSDTVDVIDATHMASPNRTREFIAGLSDPGECSFEMNFLPGSQSDVLLKEIVQSGAAVKCRITFPNSVTWTFDGVATGYSPSIPTDDRMTANVTFKVTGSYVAGVA